MRLLSDLARRSGTRRVSIRVQGDYDAAYQRLIAAQENFDKQMARVNDWILEGIEKGAASPIIMLG